MQSVRRARKPQPPPVTREISRQLAEAREREERRAGEEHRSLLRGMLWAMLLVLAVGVARAGWGRVFVHGWWRQW
jgi:hypothetical protein